MFSNTLQEVVGRGKNTTFHCVSLLWLESGWNYIVSTFNVDIKKFLDILVGSLGGSVSSHNFRSEITTSMAIVG